MEAVKVYAYPVSAAQHRLWLLSKFGKANAAYNITGVLKVSANLDTEAFKLAILKVIERHEALRTTFKEVDGKVRQLISEEIEFEFEEMQIGGDDELQATIREKAACAFDLEQGPLLRVCIITRNTGDHCVVISMHHIISDGWSIGIFIKECSEIYNGLRRRQQPGLKELEVQYADYTLWEK